MLSGLSVSFPAGSCSPIIGLIVVYIVEVVMYPDHGVAYDNNVTREEFSDAKRIDEL
jgi:hypothetical protein